MLRHFVMQRYDKTATWQNYFASSQNIRTFAPSLLRVMAMTVEELNCLTNHHLEENSSITYDIGTFVLSIGTSVHDCRWFVVNQ